MNVTTNCIAETIARLVSKFFIAIIMSSITSTT